LHLTLTITSIRWWWWWRRRRLPSHTVGMCDEIFVNNHHTSQKDILSNPDDVSNQKV
jgi:hypothetical protein